MEHIDVEFLQPNVALLNRDNVAIIAKFAPKENPNAEFIVATTHLLYNPRRQDVRLAQTQVLLTEIERIAFRKQGDRYCEILLKEKNKKELLFFYLFVVSIFLLY